MPTDHLPIVTVVLITVNVIVYAWQALVLGGAGPDAAQQAIVQYGVVPARVASDPVAPATLLAFVTSMFMHGGLLHIASNMLYLWIFGNNIEDVLGHVPFLLFYFVAGFAASAAQVAASWGSSVPAIGASGAIAGVLGAYLVFYPGAKVDTLVFFGWYARLVAIPAAAVLGIWFLLQFLSGILSVGAEASGGVAYWAHIGGFATGMLLCLPWRGRAHERAARASLI
jgi:membrane associated rhomboid family serine protease